MQQHKFTKNISEITNYCGDSTRLVDTFERVLKNFKLTYPKCLIVDDSLLPKSGKYIDDLSK